MVWPAKDHHLSHLPPSSLYNKEAVLLALLDKSSMPEIASHVRSLKDVTELKLTPNPSYEPSEKASAASNGRTARFVCPVSGLEMSGRHRFVFLRGCGCVFAEKALKEVPSENCHKVRSTCTTSVL